MPIGTGARKRHENHEAVMTALGKAGRPQTAYEILNCLRPLGITSPPTVYRALERLQMEGRIHRLESLNAFVPCHHPHHGAAVLFTICDHCGSVEEIVDTTLESQLVITARRKGFTAAHSLTELHGLCKPCAGNKKSAGKR